MLTRITLAALFFCVAITAQDNALAIKLVKATGGTCRFLSIETLSENQEMAPICTFGDETTTQISDACKVTDVRLNNNQALKFQFEGQEFWVINWFGKLMTSSGNSARKLKIALSESREYAVWIERSGNRTRLNLFATEQLPLTVQEAETIATARITELQTQIRQEILQHGSEVLMGSHLSALLGKYLK